MRTILISTATFILGAAAGGSAIAWAYNEFLIQPTAMSTQTYEATINLTALNALREGKPDTAASSLENALDANLIALGFYPENQLSNQLSDPQTVREKGVTPLSLTAKSGATCFSAFATSISFQYACISASSLCKNDSLILNGFSP